MTVAGTSTGLVGPTADLLDVAADVRTDWTRTGLHGGFLARHLATGAQLGFDPTRPLPLASVVKVPIALVLYDLIDHGELDAAMPIRLEPAVRTPGPAGLSLFQHPCTVAVADLIIMMLSISDNAAADALLDLVPPDRVSERLAGWGWHDLTVRHLIRELYQAMAQLPDASLPHLLELAVGATTRGGGHALPQLDTSHANAGTAGVLVELLDAVWTDRVSTPRATAALRAAMGHQRSRHRMGAELISDLTRLHTKTGTFLNLRHEVGVVTTAQDEQVAIAALTVSSLAVDEQPEADAAIGAAARAAVEALTG